MRHEFRHMMRHPGFIQYTNTFRLVEPCCTPAQLNVIVDLLLHFHNFDLQ